MTVTDVMDRRLKAILEAGRRLEKEGIVEGKRC